MTVSHTSTGCPSTSNAVRTTASVWLAWGMQTFETSLVELVRAGMIATDEARVAATNRHDFGLALSKAALV